METSQKQTSLFTEIESTSYPEGSHVKMQALQNKTVKVNRGYKANAQGYSSTCAELFQKSDQDLLSPKMYLTFLKLTEGKTLAQYSPNYPEWGTMQNGEFAARQMSVPTITGQGSIWLLTPTTSDSKRDRLSFPMYAKRHHRSPGSLGEHLYRLFGAVPGRINPQFYAWMMGFPKEWITPDHL